VILPAIHFTQCLFGSTLFGFLFGAPETFSNQPVLHIDTCDKCLVMTRPRRIHELVFHRLAVVSVRMLLQRRLVIHYCIILRIPHLGEDKLLKESPYSRAPLIEIKSPEKRFESIRYYGRPLPASSLFLPTAEHDQRLHAKFIGAYYKCGFTHDIG